jgi:hypothetical protein
MNEEYWAERLSRELDGLISQTEKIPTSGAPPEFHEALQVAQELTQLNFSADSRQREALRRRLIDQARRGSIARKVQRMKTRKLRRALVFSIVGLTLVFVLMTSLFTSGGVVAAAQNVYGVIRSIVLGEYSRAMQTTPMIGNDPAALPPDVWKIRTEIGNFSGNAPPGVEPIVRSVTTLKEAQAIANFHLMTPTDLPAGYTLREVKLAPIGGTHWVLSFYGGGAHDIIIVQMPGGPQPSTNPNWMTSIGTVFGTEGTLEEIELDGRTAVWIEGRALMWLADGINYVVGGSDLTLEEAKYIARSLR